MSHYSPKGSIWNRWDLHFHTPSSYDYKDQSVTNAQIVKTLNDAGVRVVAITDHHVIDVPRIRELQKLAGDALTVLPGIELRSDQGGDPIHYICIFGEDCDLDHVWATLQGTLGLTSKAIQDKGGDHKVYVPIETGSAIARELGGIVSIHAGTKSNSIEGIKNKEQFQQRIKFDITKRWVDVMEVGQIKDIESHLNIIFPATGLERPLVVCSDNHKVSEYGAGCRLWLRADPCFRGLLMVLREPQGRVYIGERPDDMVRMEQNRTKYVHSVEFTRKAEAPDGQRWFSGSVEFNHGLVAIVGNKGSGKSALADTLGLLGASKHADTFSFLSEKRFRRTSGGFAHLFDAKIRWVSGEEAMRCLSDKVQPTEVERIKYLPQDHVESVCNELVGIAETEFEKELKSVIFSHVPESLRLGQSTLDDLVKFQTGEKQKRIDGLLRQLRDVSRNRATLELQANPDTKRELDEKVRQRSIELEAHDKAKPPEKANPQATDSAPMDPELLKALAASDSEKRAVEAEVEAAKATLRTQERRLAVAKRLIEKLDNFAKDFALFRVGLDADATELGIPADELATVKIEKAKVEAVRDAATTAITAARKLLSTDAPDGLPGKLSAAVLKVTEVQSKLDAPNRAYQAYLAELAEWTQKRGKIEGSDADPESLKGLQAALAALGDVPAKIAAARNEQASIATEIHREKVAQAEVFRSLYKPVQEFIDTHPLAKDKLKLEFRADLTDVDFENSLLGFLSLNRRGSFMGGDDGRAKARALVEGVKWDTAASVISFLDAVDTALHEDQRDATRPPVQMKDQLVKGKRVEDVFNMLYGLEYVEPRYVLRWEGKDLAMLSPGERGTLLLVFYLLIDQGDMPLVIDQPEGNLDNHTVAKVLVDCIREARRHRQVFIVTHNPNLAVVCDADQVIHAKIDKANGNQITYTTGSLENPAMTEFVTDVLEGTRWAFGVRGEKYKVGERQT